MGLRAWRQQRQQQKIARYIAAHIPAALNVLRQDPTLATHVVSQALELQAGATPHRETLQYPGLGQLGMGARAALSTALPKPTAINLRRFSEYPPARRAINALCNPILDLNWWIVPTAPMYDETKPDTWPTDMQERSAAFTQALQTPNASDSWRTLLESVLEDMCVGGYGAIELKLTGNYEQPFWLWPVDGQSIRVNTHWDGEPNVPRYTQSLGYAGMSVATHANVELRDDELLYIRLNPRTHTPFGLGYLEVAFQTISAFMGAFDFATRRASNATPDYLLFLGENIDIPTTRMWEQYWRQMIEGYAKTPVIGGGVHPEVLQLRGGSAAEDPLYLQWQQWLVRMIAISFGVSPMKLGLEQDVNYNTSKTQAEADWETSAPIAEAFSDSITTHLLWRVLGWRDLKFVWNIRPADDLKQADIMKRRWESNSITIDEQRATWGDPALPDGRGAHIMLEAVAQAEVVSQVTPTDKEIVPNTLDEATRPDDPVENDVPHDGV